MSKILVISLDMTDLTKELESEATLFFSKGQKINPVAAYATVSATKNLLIIGKKYN